MPLVALTPYAFDGESNVPVASPLTCYYGIDDGGGEPPAEEFALGPVYWTRAEIDSWTPGPAFTALLGSYVGNNWTPTVFGTLITTSGEMDDFHGEAIRCLGSAIIWAVNGSAQHLADATAYLDNVSEILTINAAAGQDNLETCWAVCNFVRAAWIIEYEISSAFDAFLRDVCWPLLDFTNIANCWAAGAAARFFVASLLEDQELWDDTLDYVVYQSTRSIYDPAYDGGSIEPLTGFYLWPNQLGDVTANENATEQHWWNIVAHPAYTASYSGYTFVAGVNAETLRDLGHEVMGLTGWVMAAQAIQTCGDTIPAEFADRLEAMVAFVGARVLYYLENGSMDPSTPNGLQTFTSDPTGVGKLLNYGAGWYAAKRLYGDAAPAVVDDLLADPDIVASNIVGINHQTFDRYCDGSLI